MEPRWVERAEVDGRRCDEPQAFRPQEPSVAPDSTRRPSRVLRADGLADTFPVTDGDCRLAGEIPGAAPLLAVREVLALAAAPTGVGEEVLGFDRERDLADEPRGPGQILDR